MKDFLLVGLMTISAGILGLVFAAIARTSMWEKRLTALGTSLMVLGVVYLFVVLTVFYWPGFRASPFCN